MRGAYTYHLVRRRARLNPVPRRDDDRVRDGIRSYLIGAG